MSALLLTKYSHPTQQSEYSSFYSKIPKEVLNFSILSFLSGEFLIKSCSLVSREWLHNIRSQIPLSLRLDLSSLMNNQNIDSFLEYQNEDCLSCLERLTLKDVRYSVNQEKQDVSMLSLKGDVLERVLCLTHKRLIKLSIININLTCKVWHHVSKFSSLKSLTVQNCTVGNEKYFDFSVFSNSGLEELNLFSIPNPRNVPKLVNLTKLTARLSHVEDSELEQMINLKTLKINKCDITDRVNKIINIPSLTELNLEECKINEHCENISSLIMLQYLNLSGNNIGNGGLGNVKSLNNITELRIERCGIDCYGFNGLEGLGQLRILSIDHNDLSPPNYAQTRQGEETGIVKFSKLTNLTDLSTYLCSLNNEHCSEISKLQNLTKLNIGRNAISTYGISQLAKLTNLIDLKLASTNIQNNDCEILSNMPSLKCIRLQNNDIGISGLIHLSRMTHLEDLDLSHNPISDDCLPHLDSFSHMIIHVGVKQLSDCGKLKLLAKENLVVKWLC